jgi:hypothetical protein
MTACSALTLRESLASRSLVLHAVAAAQNALAYSMLEVILEKDRIL